jgi:hypothetical protein
MKRFNSLLILLGLLASFQLSFAQDAAESDSVPLRWDKVTDWEKKPRYEDHFWRRKVRRRVDLLEKINEPMNKTENAIYDEASKRYTSFQSDKYEYRKGIKNALLDGFTVTKEIDGFDPDTLDKPLTPMEFKARYAKESDEAETAVAGGDWETEEGDEGDEEGEWDTNIEDESGKGGGGDVLPGPGKSGENDYTNIPPFFDIIEDVIFDKNKSSIYYDIQYIILYVNKAGGAGAVPIVAYRYDDNLKKSILQKCQWKNRFNDAEYKNLQEVLELRMFNSILLNVSGIKPATLDEAEQRRVQLLEFEHNLWQF